MRTALRLSTLLLLACPIACTSQESSPAAAQATADKAAAEAAAARGIYGDPVPTTATPLAVEAVLASPASDTLVTLEGQVAKVCQASGCWLELAGTDKTLTLLFEDGAGKEYTVAKDLAGKRIRAFGKVESAGGETQLIARGIEVLP